MTRQKYNKTILEVLEKMVNKYPDLRFGQILVNSDIIKLCPTNKGLLAEDPFYEESEVTWERVSKNTFVFPRELKN